MKKRKDKSSMKWFDKLVAFVEWFDSKGLGKLAYIILKIFYWFLDFFF